MATSILNHLSPTAQGQCQLLTGETSLTEAIDLLAACAAVVCNDSGLLSERVKTVHTDIDCRPCFKRECPLGHLNCLKQLEPDRVWQALQQLLA